MKPTMKKSDKQTNQCAGHLSRQNHKEQGSALAVAMLLSLVFSALLLASLLTVRGQAPLSKYHVSSTKAYYLAEKGLSKGALWFTQNFAIDPTQAGRFVLPMKYGGQCNNQGISNSGPGNNNSQGCRSGNGNQHPSHSLSYFDPAGTGAGYVYSKPPDLLTSFDAIPTSVKVEDANGLVRNVVLSARPS